MAHNLEAKIVVLGSQGVGKTSLVHRYVKNAFTPPTTTSTIGASFLTKRVVDIDSSTTVRLQIWDTAGQERFRSISKLYYRGMSSHSGTTLAVEGECLCLLVDLLDFAPSLRLPVCYVQVPLFSVMTPLAAHVFAGTK
jgi:signal recognition particle receptor subunit beta